MADKKKGYHKNTLNKLRNEVRVKLRNRLSKRFPNYNLKKINILVNGIIGHSRR